MVEMLAEFSSIFKLVPESCVFYSSMEFTIVSCVQGHHRSGVLCSLSLSLGCPSDVGDLGPISGQVLSDQI